jgi:hypothetical protein
MVDTNPAKTFRPVIIAEAEFRGYLVSIEAGIGPLGEGNPPLALFGVALVG